MYELKIDLNHYFMKGLTHRFTFAVSDAAGQQHFVLRRVGGEQAVDPHAENTLLAEDIAT
jgi:hypothetical protein